MVGGRGPVVCLPSNVVGFDTIKVEGRGLLSKTVSTITKGTKISHWKLCGSIPSKLHQVGMTPGHSCQFPEDVFKSSEPFWMET